MKVALAAERCQSSHLDNIAGFWEEWVNEEVEEEGVKNLKSKAQSQRQPIISTTIYEKEDIDICKVRSMDEGLPDPDLDLLQIDDPPLRSSKSMSTEADSNDLTLQEQQQQMHQGLGKGFRGNKGGYYRCDDAKYRNESEPKGEVVINAKPAGVIAAAARAAIF